MGNKKTDWMIYSDREMSVMSAQEEKVSFKELLTLPTAKAGGFLLQPLLHWLIPFGISMSYTVSTS